MSVTDEPEPSSFSPILVVLKVEISFFGVAVLFELLNLDTASEVFDDLEEVVTENYICKSKIIFHWYPYKFSIFYEIITIMITLCCYN